MRELGFDGVSEDQQYLLARDASTDETFRVLLTDEARSLVGSTGSAGVGVDVSSSATGSEPAMETSPPLSPRDIQSRVRRGESAVQVAESSGMSISTIEAFAGPVLAERVYMHEQARKTSLRRKHVTGAGVSLGALVEASIMDDGGSPEAAVWDAWRREDGLWTVLVTPAHTDTTATFVYDTRGRYVVPADDVAHELVGDVSLPDTPDMAIADAVRADQASAPNVQTAAEISADHEFTDLPTLLDELPPDIAAAEALLDAAEAEVSSSVSSLKAARDRRAQEALAKSESEAESEAQEDVDHLEDSIESDVAVPDTAGPRKKRNERRRVPSWDEIMFGGKDD